MRIPAFADVCLRVLIFAAQSDKLTTTRTVAESIDVPYNHVSKAVLELRRRGMIEVQRGRLGGLRVLEEGRRLSVGALVRDLDDQPDVVDCTRENGRDCPFLEGCRLRGAFERAREAFYRELDDVHVQDLVPPQRGGPALLGMPPIGAPRG